MHMCTACPLHVHSMLHVHCMSEPRALHVHCILPHLRCAYAICATCRRPDEHDARRQLRADGASDPAADVARHGVRPLGGGPPRDAACPFGTGGGGRGNAAVTPTKNLTPTLTPTLTLTPAFTLSRPGLAARAEGQRAHHPVVMIPGIISSGLELWRGKH